jgi:hypothetical protein
MFGGADWAGSQGRPITAAFRADRDPGLCGLARTLFLDHDRGSQPTSLLLCRDHSRPDPAIIGRALQQGALHLTVFAIMPALMINGRALEQGATRPSSFSRPASLPAASAKDARPSTLP